MKKKLSVLLLFVLLITGCTATKEETKSDEFTVYLVRHGKTFFNTTGQVQGFADSPLTEAGIEGAKKAGVALKDIEFESVYTGDLGRQRNTARIIIEENNKKEVPFNEHIGFQEWNYGGFEGKTNAEMWTPIMEKHGFTFDEDWTDYEALMAKIGDRGAADEIAALDPLKAAESYDEIVERGTDALDTLVKESKGGNILVVSSGGMIPTMMEIALPGVYNGEIIENSSITILKYSNGKYSIESINDIRHLD
ncbi:histidine phosphatase family protein [Erysipelothrix urinaevulpis]|uniref:histidine phosphatase family protein n=1 Tax=Erysipelothrix urinaevulpis TaxID=2683717 RepID=UPI00135B8136|nr:histidine phosphatase family protein [Erysipelothrix urinaevulpis]